MIDWTDLRLLLRARKLPDLVGVGGLLISAVAWPMADGGPRASAQHATSPSSVLFAAAEKIRPAHEHTLIAQKLRLLEAYFRSARVAALRRRGDAGALELLARAGEYMDEARTSLAAGQFAAAEASLDNGLRLLTRAAASGGKGTRRPGRAEAERRYVERRRLVRRYLEALARARNRNQAGAADDGPVAQIENLAAKSESLARAGRYHDANKVLTRTYQAVVTTVADLRKGQTLVSSLTFGTAEEELEYERSRNGSYEMLVRIMIRERKFPDADFPALADGYIEASRKLRDAAESLAAEGNAASAIANMERATGKLIRALRAGGLAVPE